MNRRKYHVSLFLYGINTCVTFVSIRHKQEGNYFPDGLPITLKLNLIVRLKFYPIKSHNKTIYGASLGQVIWVPIRPDQGSARAGSRKPENFKMKPGNRPGTRVFGPGRKTRPGPEFFSWFFFQITYFFLFIIRYLFKYKAPLSKTKHDFRFAIKLALYNHFTI